MYKVHVHVHVYVDVRVHRDVQLQYKYCSGTTINILCTLLLPNICSRVAFLTTHTCLVKYMYNAVGIFYMLKNVPVHVHVYCTNSSTCICIQQIPRFTDGGLFYPSQS